MTREAAILRHASSHEAIATLVDCYEDSSHVHFVLELCSGGMLHDSMRSGGHYSEQKAADIFRQMARIVDYLHGQGVMHRDLKLENFMLASPEPNAALKAIDFGLSTFFEPGGWCGGWAGWCVPATGWDGGQGGGRVHAAPCSL